MLRAYGPAAATEPPMTAEEEEQAPEDPYEGEQGNCATGASEEALAMFERLKAKAQEIKAETTHRPPYAVAYSVSGTAYEALLPGDCRVEAIDGALVIRHPKPVNGIVTVSPVGKAS